MISNLKARKVSFPKSSINQPIFLYLWQNKGGRGENPTKSLFCDCCEPNNNVLCLCEGSLVQDRALVGREVSSSGASLAFLMDTPTWEICPEACRVLLAQCEHSWFGWEGWWWKESWWKDRSNHKYQLEMWLIYNFWRAKNFIVNTVLEGRGVFASLFCLVDAFVKPFCYMKCISVSKNCFYSCTN